MQDRISVAVVGGSGLYELAELKNPREVAVETPYGAPSDAFRVGELSGRTVAFLARHGRGHRFLPTEVNYRANIWALKSLGVEWILSASAVGSLRERIEPRHVVAIDQFVDRTRLRPSTFFGDGLVAHVSMADPICPTLRGTLVRCATVHAPTVHDGGCYVCMEGPAFSTRAESELYRSWGMDVIGMTNIQEARLAREAEICYATLALVTDYDCWHAEEDDVSVATVLEILRYNARLAAEVIAATIEALPRRGGCPCVNALEHAIITAPDAIDPQAVQRLHPIVGRYLEASEDRGA